MRKGRLIFLGTGTSYGVPRLACSCQTCTSPDPRDRRLRTSALIEQAGRRLLVDTTPDLRQQLLRERIDHLDAVFLTHFHADHVFGLDDLRGLTDGREAGPLPVYCAKEVAAACRRVFPYVFAEQTKRRGIPWLELHEVDAERGFELGGLPVRALPLPHGGWTSWALRWGNVAWLTDCLDVPEPWPAALRGLDVLALDMLRARPNPTHMHLQRSLHLAAKLAAARTWLIHMGHEVRHAAVEPQLPRGVRLAWDGLCLELPGGALLSEEPRPTRER